MQPNASFRSSITPLPGPKAKRVVERDHAVCLAVLYARLSAGREDAAAARWSKTWTATPFSISLRASPSLPRGIAIPRSSPRFRSRRRELIHMSCTDFYYPGMVELAEKLAAIAPGKGAKRVYFGNSGTEAIEAAMKLARYHTKRDKFIAFYGCFHGRTMGALSLTAARPCSGRVSARCSPACSTRRIPIPIAARTVCVRKPAAPMRSLSGKRDFQAPRRSRRSRRHFRRADPGRGRIRAGAGGIPAGT